VKGKIDLASGSGGEATKKLVSELFLKYFGNRELQKLADSALVNVEGKIAFTTDSFVVKPLLFPGGDIGKLAIFGTVNDLSVMGAKPLFISCAFIIEEGFDSEKLEKVVKSMAEAARQAKVEIVCGDTKVVEKGAADEIFINTSGIGKIIYSRLEPSRIKVGDAIIITGAIAEHGMAVMCAREKFFDKTPIKSDCAPVTDLILPLLKGKIELHASRDPTRGGLAAVLNELAASAKVGMMIVEDAIPIKPEVKYACEMLGIDPLYVACEGRAVIFCPESEAKKALSKIQKHPQGKDATIIGKVTKGNKVILKTAVADRILDAPSGLLLPRIC